MEVIMRDYPMKLFQIETAEGFEWTVEYPDLKGCVGGGATKEEAIKEAEENKTIYLEILRSMGKAIPVPSVPKETTASGRISLRISKTMHEQLAKYSEIEGVSINQIIVESVSEKMGMMKTVDYMENAVTRIENTLRFKYEASKIQMNKTKPLIKINGGADFGNYKC